MRRTEVRGLEVVAGPGGAVGIEFVEQRGAGLALQSPRQRAVRCTANMLAPRTQTTARDPRFGVNAIQ